MAQLKSHSTIENTVGLILMGGEAMRLGQIRKDELVVGGTSLFQRAKSALAPICQTIYASSSRELAAGDSPVLRDHGQGPAEAIANAIRSLEQNSPHLEYLVVMPVDCWKLPVAVNRRLLDAICESEADLALGCWNSKAYPINCAIRLPAHFASKSDGNVGAKGRSMWSLFEHSKVHQEEFYPQYPENPFSNINDFNDLHKAQRLVQSNKRAES